MDRQTDRQRWIADHTIESPRSPNSNHRSFIVISPTNNITKRPTHLTLNNGEMNIIKNKEKREYLPECTCYKYTSQSHEIPPF